MKVYFNNELVRDLKYFRNKPYIYIIIYKDKSIYIGQSYTTQYNKNSRIEKHINYFKNPDTSGKHRKLYIKTPIKILAFSAPDDKNERLNLEHMLIRNLIDNDFNLINCDKYTTFDFNNKSEYNKVYMKDYYRDINNQSRHRLNSRISSKRHTLKLHIQNCEINKVEKDKVDLNKLLNLRKELYGV